eukprot:2083429-Prymnesium_polylepis.1
MPAGHARLGGGRDRGWRARSDREFAKCGVVGSGVREPRGKHATVGRRTHWGGPRVHESARNTKGL